MPSNLFGNGRCVSLYDWLVYAIIGGISVRRRSTSKSFFIRFLSSYILLLLIPFLTVFFMYFFAQSSIKKEIITANKNEFYQCVSLLDGKLNEMSVMAMNLSSAYDVQKFANGISNVSSAYDIYVLKKYLNGHSH